MKVILNHTGIGTRTITFNRTMTWATPEVLSIAPGECAVFIFTHVETIGRYFIEAHKYTA